MSVRFVFYLSLFAFSGIALGQHGGDRSEDRWNVTGPNWYETKCGHVGFSVTHGLPYADWRKPCSVPIRVCEFERLTINYPADPDVPCERMTAPGAAGELRRTYLQRWD